MYALVLILISFLSFSGSIYGQEVIDVSFYRTINNEVRLIFDIYGKGLLCEPATKVVQLEVPSEAANPGMSIFQDSFLLIEGGNSVTYGKTKNPKINVYPNLSRFNA